MNEEYDAIVLGTGMTECVISGLLSMEGKKVLHIDRNPFYGGACASLSLDQLYEQFKKGPPPQAFGPSHKFNIDLAPKLLMANGKLAAILRKTVAERYDMQFMLIEGSYLLHKGKIHKVPATEGEALKSGLMGMFEKRRCAKFLGYIQEYNPQDPKTTKGWDLTKMTFMDLCKKFDIDQNTIDFIGTCIALEFDTEFLSQPALPTVEKIQLYEQSASVYGKSPYIYPLYGLSDIPQAFARLCAVHGGTYMLSKPVDKVLFGEDGRVTGIESEGEKATAPMVIADPTYFVEDKKVKKVGQVARCICFLDHPIPGIEKEAKSCQIIIPAKETKRKTDSYILLVSGVHKVCPEGLYLAIVSATVETANPAQELQHGMAMLGPIKEHFLAVYDVYEPLADGRADGCFISKSLDASSHFETCVEDILSMYQRITGKPYAD